jgi:putative oxidoreductase
VTEAVLVAFVVRCGLVMLFLPFSALDKLVNFRGGVRQAEEVFPRFLAIVAILVGLGIEVAMSLAIITGIADRAAAIVLAGYCAATAVLFKRFWAAGDFWESSDGKGRTLFWDFLKNLSLGAGILLIAVGADGAGLAPFLAHPFASSHPYAATKGLP